MMVVDTSKLIRFFETRRWPLADEKRLQLCIADEFAREGIEAEREVRLNGSDIIDFLTKGGIGIEVKIKGSKREIYRQCERYCLHDRINALILASNVPVGLPTFINGKPISFVHLGKGWL